VTAGRGHPELYAAGAYREQAPRLHRAVQPLLRLFDRQRLSYLRALHPPPARLLDAGAGRGRFVAAASVAGYDAFGIDPSPRGAPGAPPIRSASIEDAQIEQGSLDVVSLWHVLEHLEDPGAALERIAMWLRPGAGLLIGVPNLASVQARLGGERWYHLDVPRHRVHFTVAGLHAVLRGHGYSVVRTHHLLLEHNPFGMWQSLLNRLTRHPSYLYNALKRNAPLRSPDAAITIAGLPLLPLAAAVELAAGLAGRGGTIAVLARRLE
jgi:2-polyprenyl-3-methyl-5-hydroxy-6-metoxy-1,4-benzoquinol methylase